LGLAGKEATREEGLGEDRPRFLRPSTSLSSRDMGEPMATRKFGRS
jgi:hypothetical protein